MKKIWLSGLIAVLFHQAAMAQAPVAELVVYAAGSTVGALGEMLRRYTAETGQPVRMVNGPAGLLLKRIEAGEHADLFVSANMTHPQRLTAEGKAGPTRLFARNSLCVTTRPDVHLTSANMLARMLDPSTRIGTSTPGADPGGDYAWALFDRADRLQPGAGATLKGKARQLVGGSVAPQVPKGTDAVAFFLERRTVDMFIGYCSSHELISTASEDKVRVPAPLSVPIEYGMTALRQTDHQQDTAAARLADYLGGREAQAILPLFGFRKAK